MSELVPFFEEDEQLDDNLLRSIETLLDDNGEPSGNNCENTMSAATENEMNGILLNSPMSSPQYESMGGTTFAFGNQVYQKWSTSESPEQQHQPKRNFGRNASSKMQSNFAARPAAKKFMQPQSTTPHLPNLNDQIAHYQAMLADKANELLNEYLRLNYEFLSAQAQILGIPLDQYIRNLLVALQTQSLLIPNQPFLYSPPIASPVQSLTMPNFMQNQQQSQQQQLQQLQQQQQQQQLHSQRTFAKQHYFNKKN